MNIVGALIAQGFSLWTTLAFVTIFTRPGDDLRGWGGSLFYAVLGEALLFAMKEQIFKRGGWNKVIGVLGFGGDGLINAAGLTAIALGLLTLGPVALMLGGLEVNLADPTVMLSAAGVASLILGLVLSITPHVLWRATRVPAPAGRSL